MRAHRSDYLPQATEIRRKPPLLRVDDHAPSRSNRVRFGIGIFRRLWQVNIILTRIWRAT